MYLTESWLNRIRDGASTPLSRDHSSQLSGLLDLFNRKGSNTALEEPNWEDWKSKIHTPGVVDKIRDKYNAFMKTTYDVNDAVNRIDTKTEKLANLETAVTYNHAVWLMHYFGHLNLLETLNAIGDVTALRKSEVLKYTDIDVLNTTELEIGNIAPQCYVEHGISTRITTQFAWGSRYNPPFVHSSDALNSVVATLGKLGK